MQDQEAASPNLGNSRQTSRTMPETVGSILAKLPLPLPTTGRPATAEPQSSATGKQLSGPGAGALPATPTPQWVLDVWRPFELPEETMRSLSTSLTSRIRIDAAGPHRVGTDGQWEGSSVGPFRIMPGMTRREIQYNLNRINGSLQFSEAADVAKHVARLMVRTKMRQQGEGEAKLVAETLVNDLRVYPIDVVGWACDQWPKLGNIFFPAWAELRALCERRVDGRQRLKKALEYYLAEAAA